MESDSILFQDENSFTQLKTEGCVIVDFLHSKEIEDLEALYSEYKN